MAAGHPGPTLTCYGAPLDTAERAVLLLHGRDLGPEHMDEHVVRPLGLGGVAYLAPTAPGRSWYPFGFAVRRVANEPALSRALDAVAAALDEIGSSGFPRSRTYLLGFSQGACVALEHVVRHDADLAGLVAFTGALIGAPEEVAPITQSLTGLPVYLSVGEADHWVPRQRTAEAAIALRAAGAEVSFEVFPDAEHVIRAAEIDAARDLLSAASRDTPPQ
jgi:phospholipase/carboxylesterase